MGWGLGSEVGNHLIRAAYEWGTRFSHAGAGCSTTSTIDLMVDHEALVEQRISTAEMDVAMHEAGHVMLADALGVMFSRVSIEGVRDVSLERRGFCELPLEIGRCESLVVALAGRAVDERFSQHETQNRGFQAYKTDEERALEYLDKDCSAEERTNFHRRVYALCTGWVTNWVTRYRTQIQAFAVRLKCAKSLGGTELRTALDESWGGEKPVRDELIAEVQLVVIAHFAA